MRPAPRLAPALALLAGTLAWTPPRAQAPDAPDPIRPDPALTLGATVVVGHAALCTPGYARGVRPLPADVHRAVFREYGLVGAGVRTRDYEVDQALPEMAPGGCWSGAE